MGAAGTNLNRLRDHAAIVAALCLIAVMTLPAAPEAAAAAARTPWWCVACGSIGTADLFQNVVLFLPLGFALALAGLRQRSAIIGIVALTIGIELYQALAAPGRDASVGDVIANTAGGILGWQLARRRDALLRPSRREALAMLVAVTVTFAIIAAMTTQLLQPAMHDAEYTRARLTPEVEGRTRFGGEVVEFTVNGQAYKDRDVPAELPRGAVDAGITAQWPGPSAGTATIARIDGASGDAVLSIDQRVDRIRSACPFTCINLAVAQPGDGSTGPTGDCRRRHGTRADSSGRARRRCSSRHPFVVFRRPRAVTGRRMAGCCSTRLPAGWRSTIAGAFGRRSG